MMRNLYVIKIGGNIIDDEESLATFLKKFAAVKEQKILVHGGGKLATKLAEQLGIQQQLVDGRRITDAETLKIATMVYAGYINKQIVATLQSHHCNAIGISGADGNSILAHKRKVKEIDYGFAGDIDSVNSNLLAGLMQLNMTPVFCPITHDRNGQLLNTNADTIAKEIACSLTNDYEVTLIYTFEKSGVLREANDDNSVIASIDSKSYKQLKESGEISGGMIPKLDNAFSALASKVSRVVIGNAMELEGMINGEKGTSIIND